MQRQRGLTALARRLLLVRMAMPPNRPTISPERLERLRAICLALPEAAEKYAWGDPTWRVRNKIFAMQKGNTEGGRPSVWLKAEPGEQADLIDLDPDRFFAPPYVGPQGWIGIHLDGRQVDWKAVEERVVASYRLIAPKSLAARLSSENQGREGEGSSPDARRERRARSRERKRPTRRGR